MNEEEELTDFKALSPEVQNILSSLVKEFAPYARPGEALSMTFEDSKDPEDKTLVITFDFPEAKSSS